MAIDYYLDLYPADDPRDGALLGRFDATLLEDADYRDVVGVGSWQAVLKASMAEAALIDPDGEQYFRLVRDDGATEAVVGGGFDSRMAYDAAIAAETKRLTIGGPTTMAYLSRAAMAPHSYLSEFIPGSWGGDPFDRIWRLYAQGPLAGGAYLGAMLWRVLQEATHYRSGATYKHTHGDQTVATDSHANDRTENVLPALTLGFTQYLDSNGNAWTLTSGDFTAQVGENVLAVVHRLMQAGLYVSMDPDTFELNAWEDEDHRRDRTGAVWGANVVRLQAPTDGTTATGSYLSDVKRIRTSHIRRSTLWVGGGDDVYVKATGASTIPWEGFIGSDANDEAALAQIGSTQVTAREEASDVGSVRIKLGDDPLNGYYLPFEQVRVDDLVTVNTGAGDWDFTEATYPVAAVRIKLREAGDWDAYVELGGSLEAAEQRQFAVATTAAHTHSPDLRLCDPPTEGVSSSDKFYPGNGGAIEYAIDAAWNSDERPSGASKSMARTPGATTSGGTSSSIWGGGTDVLMGQHVIAMNAAEAATLAAGGSAFRGQIRCKSRHGVGISEANAHNISQVVVRVFTAAGVLRGTALAAHNLGSTAGCVEWLPATSGRNAMFPPAPVSNILAAVPGTVEGDLLVVEVGYRSFSTSTSGATIFVNDIAASDLPEDESSTLALRSWYRIATEGVGATTGDLPRDTVRQGEESAGTSNRVVRCDHEHAHGLLSTDGTNYHGLSQLSNYVYDAVVAPTVNDDEGDGYVVGTHWVDTVTGDIYFLRDATTGAAVWEQISGGGGAPLSNDIPLVESGTGSAGVDTEASRSDHVHPADGGGGGGGSVVAARAERAAALNVTGTLAAISWDTEVRDDGGLWDVGAPTRLTAPSAGWYWIVGGLRTTNNSGTWIQTQIRRNGTDNIASSENVFTTSTTPKFHTLSTLYYLNASDYVELTAVAGGTMALDVTTHSKSQFFAMSKHG
jgi:hypothetical protein